MSEELQVMNEWMSGWRGCNVDPRTEWFMTMVLWEINWNVASLYANIYISIFISNNNSNEPQGCWLKVSFPFRFYFFNIFVVCDVCDDYWLLIIYFEIRKAHFFVFYSWWNLFTRNQKFKSRSYIINSD